MFAIARDNEQTSTKANACRAAQDKQRVSIHACTRVAFNLHKSLTRQLAQGPVSFELASMPDSPCGTSDSPCGTSDSPCGTSDSPSADEDGSHAQLAGKRSASELLTSDDEEVDRPVTKKPATQATRKKPAAQSTRKKPSAAPDNPLIDASTPDACDAGDNPRILQELGSIVSTLNSNVSVSVHD